MVSDDAILIFLVVLVGRRPDLMVLYGQLTHYIKTGLGLVRTDVCSSVESSSPSVSSNLVVWTPTNCSVAIET